MSRVNSSVNFLVISATSISTIQRQAIPVFYLWLAHLPVWPWRSSSSWLAFECLTCTARLGLHGWSPNIQRATQMTASEWSWWKFHLLVSTLTYWFKVQGQERRGHEAARAVGLGTESSTEGSGGSWSAGLEMTSPFRAGGEGEAREPSSWSVPTAPAALWRPKRITMAWTRMSSRDQQQTPTGVWRAWDPREVMKWRNGENSPHVVGKIKMFPLKRQARPVLQSDTDSKSKRSHKFVTSIKKELRNHQYQS